MRDDEVVRVNGGDPVKVQQRIWKILQVGGDDAVSMPRDRGGENVDVISGPATEGKARWPSTRAM